MSGFTKSPAVDRSTQTQQVIAYEHHEIHSGSHFYYTEYDTVLDATDTMDILIVTPDTTKWGHLIFNVSAPLDTTVELFESSTHTNGSQKTTFNSNRNSSNTATLALYASNDDGADGTTIFGDSFGLSTGSGIGRVTAGGSSRGEREIELKQNTKYLFRVTSNTDGNKASIYFSWYEHRDKQ